MSDDELLKEVRRCTDALGQCLALAAMPKKTELALTQIWQKMVMIGAPPPPPAVFQPQNAMKMGEEIQH